ncbi:MAG: NYN domain-containing protein [Candidatus Eisenbacteria sp.]|nr:NYN domain-containing protein [Candidatus Eisenbacteria bacterium]
MNRTSFLVDGFNLYHSLRTASDDLGGQSTKWLDLQSLLSSYLPVIGAGATLEKIFYFSALAVHLDHRRPGVTARHRLYLECLRAADIVPILGRFKYKKVHCRRCNQDNPHYEEKETDVAISMKLVEILVLDEADTVVLVSGDTDLAPAVRTAGRLCPTKQICFGFPYKRRNNELARLVSKYFYIRKDRYVAHQFPDPVTLRSGRAVPKPASW